MSHQLNNLSTYVTFTVGINMSKNVFEEIEEIILHLAREG
jgi:hypothetical protein